jgi:hypothetical protein
MCVKCSPEFTCQICGKPVADSDLMKSEGLVGHDHCIKAQLAKNGLNESEANIKKTSFLLG